MERRTIMKNRIKRFIAVVVTLSFVAALAAGCGSNSGSGSSDSSASSGSSSESTQADSSQGETTKITIATSGAPNPFSYQEEDGTITGYDVEIIKAVLDRLPQYEYEIEIADFAAIFSGLDSDKYQIGVNNFSYNDERAEKYIYTKAIFKNAYVVAVQKDNDDIQTFEDLLGKSTEVSPDTTYSSALEAYNQEHSDNPINVSYYSDVDLVQVLQRVADGLFDFQLIDKPMFDNYMSEYDLNLKGVELSEEESNLITTPFSYVLVSKGNEQLAEDINTTLAELVKDGTIKEISEKFFNGEDYTPYSEYEE
jgi:polar amino acid transport system substrate-binding protein